MRLVKGVHQVFPNGDAGKATESETMEEKLSRIERENTELKKVVAELLLGVRGQKTRLERYKFEIRELSRRI